MQEMAGASWAIDSLSYGPCMDQYGKAQYSLSIMNYILVFDNL